MKAILVGGALALLTLGACAEREDILTGTREPVRADVSEKAAKSAPIRLPRQKTATAWRHRNGSAAHVITHPALAEAPVLAWRARIGEGNTKRQRINADPIAADGRIYVMDSLTTVSAIGMDGSQTWSRSLVPAREKAGEASGGGLAFGAGTLFATTGFGELHALDPATGAIRWTQKLEAAVNSAPTVEGGIVYVVSRDNRAWALDAKTGRIKWQRTSSGTGPVMSGGASPAIAGRLVILPFGSGEIMAALKGNGIVIWSATVSANRTGLARANISDISGDPVFSGGTIYAGNPSGRLVALDPRAGDRRWTANTGALSPVWPVGGSIFAVADDARLVRLDASSGKPIWEVDLPGFAQAKRFRPKRAAVAHYGPILAGGLIRVVSSDGLMRSYDPVSGALKLTTEIPGGATANPIVVGKTLYIVSGDGELLAFR